MIMREKNNEAPLLIKKLNWKNKSQRVTFSNIINELRDKYEKLQADRERRHYTQKAMGEANLLNSADTEKF